jgi:thioredoxin-like negative regulator of GroEL
MISPALADLARELRGRIKLVKVNVDDSPTLQQRFAIQAIPTLMILRQGQVIARQAGAAPPAALRGWLEESLSAPVRPG